MEFEPLVLTTAERVVDGLAAAVAAGLLTQVGERRYTFPHALIRETVLAEMPPSRKACMHLGSPTCSTSQGGHAGEIAKHVRAAGECAPPSGGSRRSSPRPARPRPRWPTRTPPATTRRRWPQVRRGRRCRRRPESAAARGAAPAEERHGLGAAPGAGRGAPANPAPRRPRSAVGRAGRRARSGRRSGPPRRRRPRCAHPGPGGDPARARRRARSRRLPRGRAGRVRRGRSSSPASGATRCCSPARRSVAAASACSWPPPTPRSRARSRRRWRCCPRTNAPSRPGCAPGSRSSSTTPTTTRPRR